MCFDPVSATIAATVGAEMVAGAAGTTAATGVGIGTIGTGLGLAGAGLGAYGQLQKGTAEQQQAEYAARVAEANAKGARIQGASEAERISGKYDIQKGAQIAAAAGSGVNPNAGSAALIIQGDTEKNRHLDTMASLWNSESAATAFEGQATGNRLAGKNAKKASHLNAGASFLTGLGRATGKQALELA